MYVCVCVHVYVYVYMCMCICLCICSCIGICICICCAMLCHHIKGAHVVITQGTCAIPCHTANLRTKILDFRGFDSSIILILRAGILMSIAGSFLVINLSSQVINLSREILSREMGRSTACCQSSIWKHGPSPSEI